MERLDTQAALSTTTKLGVDNLIKPVLIMIFVWAEREWDWPLHMWAVQQIIPYFFASGHTNYMPDTGSTTCGLWSDFLMTYWRTFRGQQVMHHSRGLWNGIWSDMFIETTFMQNGKRPGWTDWDHTDSLTESRALVDLVLCWILLLV